MRRSDIAEFETPNLKQLNLKSSSNPSCTPRGVPLRIPIFKQPKTVTSYDGRLLLSRPDPQEAKRSDRWPA
jgi:hypothetical protein